MASEIKMGSKCRDTLHGIEGIVTARSEFVTGCKRVCLEYVKDGEVKGYWVDEPRIEVLEAPKVEVPQTPEDRGGPHDPAPSRGPAPSRDPVR